MKYRAESPEGDYLFGTAARFHTNTPAAVAQAIKTRMALFTNEWFLDRREGLDRNLIQGYGTQGTRDRVIKRRIIDTPGVLRLVNYTSRVDVRDFYVTATVDTIYGRAVFTTEPENT